jgi:DDE superfamily endonuclease
MVLLGFEDETWLYLRPYITNTYMMKGDQQNIFHNGANKKVNAFITLLYPSNKVKFKISKSRTSNDFIDHLKNIKCYMKNNRVKRFILVIDNASFHISRKTKDFLNKQAQWLTVIFLPIRSPNLNPVETRVNRNLKKDICAKHNYQTEGTLIVAVTKYLKSIGSWQRF